MIVNQTVTGVGLLNGTCTNNGSALDPSAFSGAALASQALTELGQTTTQETSRNTITKIEDRRKTEAERCAEGFHRVDGECERIAPPVPETVAVTEETVPPVPPPLQPQKKITTAKPVVEQETAPPVSPLPAAPQKKVKKAKAAVRPKEEQLPPAKIVRREKAPPPPPVPIEPAVRFASWADVLGDYEHRDASSPSIIFADTGAGAPVGLNVQSQTGTVGFQVGADLTTRNVLFPNDGIIVGAMAGFVHSNLKLNTTATSSDLSVVGNGSGQMNANIYGPSAGLYASYFNNGFSADFLMKADAFSLNENFIDNLAFTNGGVLADGSVLPAFNFVASGSGSTSLLAGTLFGDLNYRFTIYPGYWIEPTVGAQYTNTSYGSGAANLGLQDGTLVMVQGGARFGTDFVLPSGIHTVMILTGLAYDDVLVSGGFIPGGGFLGNNILAHADQGQVRGRGLLSFNFDLGPGLSAFLQGDVRGGQGLIGAGGKAGVRYQW